MEALGVSAALLALAFLFDASGLLLTRLVVWAECKKVGQDNDRGLPPDLVGDDARPLRRCLCLANDLGTESRACLRNGRRTAEGERL